jgi:hypothetical protein
MGDGLIVRTFGGSEQTLAPTITEVSTDIGTIVFTITNNDTATAIILYETNDPLPDVDSIQLGTGETSQPITITKLGVSPAILYASANAVGKVKSNITEREFTFTPSVFTSATGGFETVEFTEGGKRYRAHVFTENGNLVVDVLGDTAGDKNQAEVLVIAGGGGSVGGGGGFRSSVDPSGNGDTAFIPSAIGKRTMSVGNNSIVIGAGGTGNGSNSSGLGITSTGGGGLNSTGGSGGGDASAPAVSGLAYGVTRAGISGEGFRGGAAGRGNSRSNTGGGGGAGGSGGGFSLGSSNGGGGATTNIIPLSAGYGDLANGVRRFAGGGGSFTYSGSPLVFGNGGHGGAGFSVNNNTANGLPNTGGGGSRGGGSAGGSGIVIIRYEIQPSANSSTKTDEYVVA